jgi:hypothetical protein
LKNLYPQVIKERLFSDITHFQNVLQRKHQRAGWRQQKWKCHINGYIDLEKRSPSQIDKHFNTGY